MAESVGIIEEIAIIGMSGRFPGAPTISKFWENLSSEVDSILHFTDEELVLRGVSRETLDKPLYVKAGTVLDNADRFDASFFGYSRHEAEMMDPQQRVFLEVAWEALESAGYTSDACNGSIGVFAGTSSSDYRKRIPGNQQSIASGINAFEVMLGNDPDYLTTRVAYKLNLKGPNLNVQTACSTSLVAVHLACLHLLTYQCDMALAGGVCIKFPQGQGYLYQEGMIWSSDGYCRPFDARASGTLFGHGAGIVVLKRLSDARADGDTILAVVKGSAVNNDGSMKVGFAAPSVDGQSEAILAALAVGDVNPDTIGYVEAHGTGTLLGDPIEIEALTRAFQAYTARTGYCAIGSVKSNIGHLDTAAGVTGLIKAVLCLQHRKIPATLHFTSPNPNIDFARTPFYVNTSLKAWQSNDHPRRCGISSFGIGGTNAHVVLEEAPDSPARPPEGSWHLVPVSARSRSALDSLSKNLADHMLNHPDLSLADAAHTLQAGRKAFDFRRAEVCQNLKEAEERFRGTVAEPVQSISAPDVVFMFSGQASQYVDMCRDLYQEFPCFKKEVDLCAELLTPHLNLDLRTVLFPSPGSREYASRQVTQTAITQPALFTIEYSLAKLWNSFGIFPSALIGHSIGEYTAACIAGVFSLADALRIVAARGRLMQSMPPGSMLAVSLSQEDVAPYLSGKIALAVVNSASMSVVSGETDAINALAETLSERGVAGKILHTSHAYHSCMMEPVLEAFENEVASAVRNTPQIPFISNVTGTWITENQAADPSYWSKHLRRTVLFYPGAETLLARYPEGILLEVGPGQTLALLTRQHPALTREHTILASTRRPVQRKHDVQYFLESFGRLWVKGCRVDWRKLHEGRPAPRRVALPTYPFERERYWIDEEQHPAEPAFRRPDRIVPEAAANPVHRSFHKTPSATLPGDGSPDQDSCLLETDTEKWIAGIWQSLFPGNPQIKPGDSFFDIGGTSLQAVQMFAQLEKASGINLPLSTLIETRDLRTLALLIDSRLKSPHVIDETWKSLIPLQPKGSRPPFFCVHGVGSNVLNYKNFIPYFGEDQPLYGLQAIGIDGITPPYTDIRAMAAHYISEIRTCQPRGPYYLGGGSLGGVIAFEIAQQLQKAGESIAFLSFFDTQAPNAVSAMDSPEEHQSYLQKLSGLSLNEKISRIVAKAKKVNRSVAQKIQVKTCMKLKRPIPHHLRYKYLEKINLRACADYCPERFNGCITLFRAWNENGTNNYDPKFGWDGLATAIRVIEIPGEHYSFVEEEEVGKQLKATLFEAQAKAREN